MEEDDFRISVQIHIVFSTKNQEPIIAPHVCQGVWAFLGDVAREHRIKVLCIGGALDHVHLFLSPPTTISLEEVVQTMKKNSTAWVRETYAVMPGFGWQEGYAAFSVSECDIPKLTAYIENQGPYHLHTTFKEEYVALLEEHGIDYDPDDLWT